MAVQDSGNNLQAGARGPDHTLVLVALEEITGNPFQPRHSFDEQKLRELSLSMAHHGVIQPPVVVKREGRYQLVIGERRVRAARQAGIKAIPVIVKELDDSGLLEMALIENLHREDLNPIEEAQAYHALMEEYHYSQEQLSQRVGRSRPTITNALRLLRLPDEIQEALASGGLTAGHGKALLSLEDPALQKKVALKVLESRLSVRETEELTRRILEGKTALPAPSGGEWKEMEEALGSYLGTKVTVRGGKGGKGTIVIHYGSDTEMNRLMEHLMADMPAIRSHSAPLESSLL
ncbi:MAG: ParB/RepB/Spo0J family partition protein [Candidatus Eremiobacteraeota bacterium]|nr:ParB/RepB/Spo0J family partition protein [Candidatus Eremiobacteraeota bacterium]